MCIRDRPVNSPTFTIIQEYESGRMPFYHFDVYRIGDIEEMEEIGYDDYFYGNGDVYKRQLMRRFRSVENIRDASVEELSQTESMNVQSAEAVYQFFHRAPNQTNA